MEGVPATDMARQAIKRVKLDEVEHSTRKDDGVILTSCRRILFEGVPSL